MGPPRPLGRPPASRARAPPRPQARPAAEPSQRSLQVGISKAACPPPAEPAPEPEAPAEPEQPAAHDLVVTLAGTDDKLGIRAQLCGEYNKVGENHDKPTYRKDVKGPKASSNVFLYFWNDKQCQVWLHNKQRSSAFGNPPEA
ncbi:unnamed protein product [Prorocentrum cordatum]|uniref:Uncharacterized protein n=1 Tax=Prorocentrum cordatum TaxID=2364126 RepID=A0ABN9SAJ9_9DINO|nr:unnamed protein product [Polarella glacialis]